MDQLTPGWRKSSYSGNGGANCLEAGNTPGRVLVRDTTDRNGGMLSLTTEAWQAFTATLR